MSEDRWVEIYDPNHPGAPRKILRADFTPSLGHRRWRYRPAVQPMRFGAELGAPEDVVKALKKTELKAGSCALDLAIMGRDGLTKAKGVGEATADAVFEWFCSTEAGTGAMLEVEGRVEHAAEVAVTAGATITTNEAEEEPTPLTPEAGSNGDQGDHDAAEEVEEEGDEATG